MNTTMPISLPAEPLLSAPVSREEAPHKNGGFIDLLLRDRARFLSLIDDESIRASLARTMLLTTVVCAAAFGASIGLYRGGWQTLITAFKLPLIELVTAMLCAPALSALNAGVLGKTDLRRDFVLLVSSFSLATLVLAGLAPLMLLAHCYELEYHNAILLLVGCCLVAGILGITLLLKGLPRGSDGKRTMVGPIVTLLLFIVGAQVTWTFRPYIGRPAQENVPMFRSVEGDFFDSATTSMQSARGIYRSAP